MYRWYFSKKLNEPKDIQKLCLPFDDPGYVSFHPCEFKFDIFLANTKKLGIFHHIIIDTEFNNYSEQNKD